MSNRDDWVNIKVPPILHEILSFVHEQYRQYELDEGITSSEDDDMDLDGFVTCLLKSYFKENPQLLAVQVSVNPQTGEVLGLEHVPERMRKAAIAYARAMYEANKGSDTAVDAPLSLESILRPS